MSVKLRTKAKAGGKKSQYLDIWHNGKRYYEFLKDLPIIRARTPKEAEQNQTNKRIAENIRADREKELPASNYNYVPAFKGNTDFIAYYKKYVDTYKNKDVRLVNCSYNHFVKFKNEQGIKQLEIKDLSESLCKAFSEYLKQNLNGETPFNYFKKFKALIKQAYKEKLILSDLTENIKNNKTKGLKKDILNYNEIQTLALADCGNLDVKRAFLFSLNTGLRYCDVKELIWHNINKTQLKITQKKVKNTSENAMLTIDLNPTAIKLIGSKGKPDELIFNLPSHTGCLKSLRVWVKKAGLDKHITWHCARHSFAVNLLGEVKADVKTVASLLGHSGLKSVEIYTRAIDENMKKAVNSLPKINF